MHTSSLRSVPAKVLHTEEANDKMFERNYFGMMMVETGDADAFITGLYTKYSNTIKVAKEVIGIRPEYKHFGTMHILNSKKGTYFLADTLINRHPDTSTLIDIAKLADQTVRFFNHTPVISMLSYSNFGSDQAGSPLKVHEAVAYMQQEYPELAIDGEMQVNFAMNRELRDSKYPFTPPQRQGCQYIGIPQPEFCQRRISAAASHGPGYRIHRPDPDGTEQTYPLYGYRKLGTRHRKHHSRGCDRRYCRKRKKLINETAIIQITNSLYHSALGGALLHSIGIRRTY